jgi:hypothetical protein
MPRNITIKTICLIYSCLVSITYASDAMATGGHVPGRSWHVLLIVVHIF